MWGHVGLLYSNLLEKRSSETSVYNKSTWRHIPEDDIVYFYAECFKTIFTQLFCVASVTQKFILKGVQSISRSL
jgi:hypothetical protein